MKKGDKRAPSQIPEAERDYFLERKYPSFGNLVPRDVASRNAKAVCDEGRGVGESGLGVYLDFRDAIQRLGEPVIKERYGNLFDMYDRITGEDPYKVPMRIYPAIHYTMGGLWVDYNLMSTVPGLYVIGEANFSDHGANRLGASALMQGLADGYFVLPYTIGDYLASEQVREGGRLARRGSRGGSQRQGDHPQAAGRQGQALGGFLPSRTGQDHVGLLRHGAQRRRPQAGAGPDSAAARAVLERREGARHGRGTQPVAREGRARGGLLRTRRVDVPATRWSATKPAAATSAKSIRLPKARRARDDEHYSYAAAWEFQGVGQPPALHKEPLTFEYVHPSQRSYK